MLLRALGDDGAPCGRCDNCRARFRHIRRVARLPAAAAQYVQAKAGKVAGSLAAARLTRQDESSDHAELRVTFRDPRAASLAPLTIAQERALLRLKSARLSIARKKRCAPASVAPDNALHEIARAESVSRDAIRETLMRHELHDEALVRSVFEALQQEFRNA
jgi:superfamily II DNA helicase RecQ